MKIFRTAVLYWRLLKPPPPKKDLWNGQRFAYRQAVLWLQFCSNVSARYMDKLTETSFLIGLADILRGRRCSSVDSDRRSSLMRLHV